LLALVVGLKQEFNFIVLCNWLGMTRDEAYAALRPLSSVLDFPGHDEACAKELRYFHKSFIDYISDFARSGFSCDIKCEAHELNVQCTFRILEQAPNGIDVGGLNSKVFGEHLIGTLARGPDTGGNTLLSWYVDEQSGWDDNRTKLFMYKTAIRNVADGIRHREQAFCTVFCIYALATRFRVLSPDSLKLLEVVFVSPFCVPLHP
jgi:hypothetical protein